MRHSEFELGHNDIHPVYGVCFVKKHPYIGVRMPKQSKISTISILVAPRCTK